MTGVTNQLPTMLPIFDQSTELGPIVIQANPIILLHSSQATLISQLRHFPKADHDDGPDALEMLWRNAVGSSAAIEWIGLDQLDTFDVEDEDDDLYSFWRD
ncbi:conserved hypothetical protein [Haemophilus influenzae HK1212]|uniref:Uncharacterized protein n=1 Tax=Haemophilus influenzae HK1212 TaxID=456482 RepID=A0A7G2JZE2_HAEIF|nr:conserved hypothetical protein [Haemophilus influenzae HK1212]